MVRCCVCLSHNQNNLHDGSMNKMMFPVCLCVSVVFFWFHAKEKKKVSESNNGVLKREKKCFLINTLNINPNLNDFNADFAFYLYLVTHNKNFAQLMASPCLLCIQIISIEKNYLIIFEEIVPSTVSARSTFRIQYGTRARNEAFSLIEKYESFRGAPKNCRKIGSGHAFLFPFIQQTSLKSVLIRASLL